MEILDVMTVKNMQPLILAAVGDSVHTLHVRSVLAVTQKFKANALSKEVSKIVNAGNQCKVYFAIESSLTDEELAIAKRARNTHMGARAKNYSAGEYIHATAYEAVLGFLYLTGQTQRLNYILGFGEVVYAN